MKIIKVIKLIPHFFLGTVIGLVVLVILATIAYFDFKKTYADRVYPGVNLFSESVSGKTKTDLLNLIKNKETNIQNKEIVFVWKGTEEKQWTLTPKMFDFNYDEEKISNSAFGYGRSYTDWRNVLEIYHLFLLPQTVKPQYSFDSDKLDKFFDQISLEVDRPMQEGLFEFNNGKVTTFQPAKEGRAIDKQEARSLVLMSVSQENSQETKQILELPVTVLIPKTQTTQANELGIKELIGEGDSYFKDSIPTRVYNIILASSFLHGVMIPPGGTFSFGERVGDISSARGYKQAYVIKEGKTVLDDGGGVCQVSTTMFRAALNAGLPIVERQAHLYRVGFYEQGGYPPGLDATVYPPNPDFKFLNDTQSYILIQTKVDQDQKKLSFLLYGTSDGRKVELAKSIIHSQTPPPDPVYVDEPTLPLGTVKKLDSAHWGAKVSVNWKVYYANGDLKEDRTFWSNYIPWAAVYQRGTRP
jgi:vancomycin resistance protein YoaR